MNCFSNRQTLLSKKMRCAALALLSLMAPALPAAAQDASQAAAASAATAATEPTAKYVFYFIGDGMGPGAASITNAYLRNVRGGDGLLMTQLPVTGLATTHSASSLITDSAAGGTALATASKTRNSMIGMRADSTEVSSIAMELQQNGYGVGVLTTVRPDDATPAAFYAHVPHRSMYEQIGRQAARSGFSFIGGSNWRGLTDKEGRPTGVAAEMAQAGYETVRGVEGFRGATAEKVIMLSPDSVRVWDVGYTLDRPVAESAGLPTLSLPQLTEAALTHLQRVSPERFFLMVEGGNIDWAAHANDGATIIKETDNFNRALAQAVKFYNEHPEETLIVVTADHETGGTALGADFLSYDTNLPLIDRQRISKDRFNDRVEAMLKSRRVYDYEADIRPILLELFGIGAEVSLTPEQEQQLRQAYDDTFSSQGGKRTETMYKTYSPFVTTLFKLLNDHYGIGFTTVKHTGNMVPVYAVGVGSEAFDGVIDNTDIPRGILRAAGLRP